MEAKRLRQFLLGVARRKGAREPEDLVQDTLENYYDRDPASRTGPEENQKRIAQAILHGRLVDGWRRGTRRGPHQEASPDLADRQTVETARTEELVAEIDHALRQLLRRGCYQGKAARMHRYDRRLALVWRSSSTLSLKAIHERTREHFASRLGTDSLEATIGYKTARTRFARLQDRLRASLQDV